MPKPDLPYIPLDTVRIGFIGLGTRGMRAINRFLHMDGAEIVALADSLSEKTQQALQVITDNNYTKPVRRYHGDDAWRKLCELPDIDLIYICTDWLSHTPISVYALEHEKDVVVEVPAATTIDECWLLVETVKRTQRRFMMLENCCYDFFELTVLNMVREGLLGEILHGEGAYIHDLRNLIFASPEKGGFQSYWHRDFNTNHSGNTYPTHGLGPICQAMDIYSGGKDRMKYLVSMSTRQVGLTEYARTHFGENSEEALQKYKLGDFSSTLIYTEMGRTVLLKNTMTMPQPYSRVYSLNGTQGYILKYPIEQIALASEGDMMLSGERIKELLEQYKHPYIKEIGEKAIGLCGERARDYIMDYRLVHCMRNGFPFDFDVNDAATWSSIIELTERSVEGKSRAVDIPDFYSLDKE